MKKMQSGLTFIELVLIIAILGILAVSVLPRFVSFGKESHIASANAVLAAAEAAASINHAAKLAGDPIDGLIVDGSSLIAAMAGLPSGWGVDDTDIVATPDLTPGSDPGPDPASSASTDASSGEGASVSASPGSDVSPGEDARLGEDASPDEGASISNNAGVGICIKAVATDSDCSASPRIIWIGTFETATERVELTTAGF